MPITTRRVIDAHTNLRTISTLYNVINDAFLSTYRTYLHVITAYTDTIRHVKNLVSTCLPLLKL